ncbi:unnamed protein product [Angiostrongylus costaricensis]|uniref:Ion_trans_2 domain-containing protein n=1 Tax=Angiostrongylus costaricensis TaxID=334426 RepID=A0A158PHF8_ANGCS|nr:unnamed protein product [Angiostrongylus costaricensis]
MALPHVGLYLSLFIYLIVGAVLFYWLEHEADEKIQSSKLDRIKHTTTGYSYAVPVTPFGQFLAIVYGVLGIPLMVLAAVDIGRFLSHIVLELYAKVLGCMAHPSRIDQRRVLYLRRSTSVEVEEKGSQDEEDQADTEKVKQPVAKRLPLSINAGILLVFCMMGAVTYIAAGGKATFLEAFFVTFNLVANLTMSEMPSDLSQLLTLIYIFVFVTFGVAVLSMCAELAALELKDIFLKIHYFGRKIKFKRRHKKEQIEVEVKELLKIIEEIRRRYPDKERITSLDILMYMKEATNERTVLTERRDTIAFMPQTMEILKFADEMDLEDRSASRMEEAPLIDEATNKSPLDFYLRFNTALPLCVRLATTYNFSITSLPARDQKYFNYRF